MLLFNVDQFAPSTATEEQVNAAEAILPVATGMVHTPTIPKIIDENAAEAYSAAAPVSLMFLIII